MGWMLCSYGLLSVLKFVLNLELGPLWVPGPHNEPDMPAVTLPPPVLGKIRDALASVGVTSSEEVASNAFLGQCVSDIMGEGQCQDKHEGNERFLPPVPVSNHNHDSLLLNGST